jgi:formate hydrogenlyase transcriptional activator
LRTDARLIAATNGDPAALVAEPKFRSDLYYRLNVFPVRVPALRERPEDIPLLVRHFVQQFGRRLGKAIDAIASGTMSGLVRYPWPGNIRELQNVTERAVVLSNEPVLNVRCEDLRPPGQPLTAPPASSGDAVTAAPNRKMREALEEAERQQIPAALEKANWVIVEMHHRRNQAPHEASTPYWRRRLHPARQPGALQDLPGPAGGPRHPPRGSLEEVGCSYRSIWSAKS